MTSKFLPVGSHFEHEGHTYEVVEQTINGDLCIGCDFFEGHLLCKSPHKTPMCIKHFRKDQKSVVFKKIK